MSDSFDPIVAPTPDSVPWVELRLYAKDDGAGGTGYSGTYQFEIHDAEGNRIDTREGNVVPHLTATQKTKLQSLMDDLFTKAKGAIT